MAKILQHRRGTTSEHSSFTGAEGELTVDTTEKRVVVHDGSTVGGIPLARTKAPNDMLHNTNEFTFIPSEYAGEVYINHRTASGYHTGAISNYHFCNGSGGYTTVIANYFKGKFQGATDRPEYNGSQVAMLSDVTVSSVNGQTGAVSVDVGVTSFNGSKGAVTYSAPVSSVNGQTGAVTLAVNDGTVSQKINTTISGKTATLTISSLTPNKPLFIVAKNTGGSAAVTTFYVNSGVILDATTSASNGYVGTQETGTTCWFVVVPTGTSVSIVAENGASSADHSVVAYQ